MIVSKPRINTLFSMGVFLLIAYGVAAFLLYDILNNDNLSTYQIFLFPIVLGIALGLTIKLIIDYKTITFQKERIDVKHLLSFLSRRYYLKNMSFWRENKVKTFGTVYKELSLQFEKYKKIKLSAQEHENYDRVYRFLKKNYPKKQQK